MIAILPLVVLGVLGQTVHGWGFHPSCDGIQAQLFAAMTTVLSRASEATTELRRTPRDKHVDALVTLLFGGDAIKVADATRRLDAIQRLGPFASRPGPYDVYIYCNVERITDHKDSNKVRDGYEDPDRGGWVRGTETIDECRGIDLGTGTSTMAYTSSKGPTDTNGNPVTETISNTLQLCPWWLAAIAGPPSTYTTPDEVIQKAADKKAKNILQKVVSKLTKGSATPVDALVNFEHVLLHEMTHSAAAGYADDVPANRCYGWQNSVKCQRSDNADSLALFALGVELIHRDYTINEDGTLQKLYSG